jgi:hypothetical protein
LLADANQAVSALLAVLGGGNASVVVSGAGSLVVAFTTPRSLVPPQPAKRSPATTATTEVLSFRTDIPTSRYSAVREQCPTPLLAYRFHSSAYANSSLRDPAVKDAGGARFLLLGLQLVDGLAEWGLGHETFRVRCALRRRRSASRIIAFLYAVVIACRSR